MDILSKLTHILTNFAAGLSPSTMQFWLRLNLLLLLPIGTCSWTFNRGYRSPFIQILAGVVGVLAALSLPLHHIRIQDGMVRLWFLTIAILLAIFIPIILPSLLLPTLGAQQRLRKILVWTVAGLVLANLIWG